MKTSATIFLLSFFGLYAFAQTSQFAPSDYPTDKYKVDTITTSYRDFNIRLIIAKFIEQPTGDYAEIWFQQLFSENKIIEKHLGETNNEHGYYIPGSQPLDNFFVVVESIEGNGTVSLIDTNGYWISLAGNYFALDSAHRYFVTKADGDGEQTISKLDLTTMKIEEKIWNHEVDPWGGNYQYYRATNDDWIK